MKRKIITLVCKISIIKNFLYKLTSRKHLLKKYKPMFKKHKKNPNMVFLVYTPIHKNLGDHAIASAEMAILDKLGILYTDITQPEIRKLKEFGLLGLFNNTKILINGGGNLGTLWFDVEEDFRSIMIAAPKADILIFPSTIYYDDTVLGRKEFENSKRIYNNHKSLTLYARENISYEIMKNAYNNVKLVPDMVFYLNKCEKNVSRDGAILCLRKDLERTLCEEDEIFIYKQIQHLFGDKITKTDMYAAHNIPAEKRNQELTKKFEQFKRAKLVITDRLHCMIFCIISGTPCIVVNSKSPKVKGCYEWVKDFEYIKFADSLSDITNLYNSIPQKEFIYDNSKFMPLYEMLKEDIRKLIH
ncbi:MAG: polysaccharide pyruvyl transferase family protein [Acutalibacteraceae bacterium]|nr:polysaccharide pyruvyl transferase family protein [Acutalibacteraceae bacterium]